MKIRRGWKLSWHFSNACHSAAHRLCSYSHVIKDEVCFKADCTSEVIQHLHTAFHSYQTFGGKLMPVWWEWWGRRWRTCRVWCHSEGVRKERTRYSIPGNLPIGMAHTAVWVMNQTVNSFKSVAYTLVVMLVNHSLFCIFNFTTLTNCSSCVWMAWVILRAECFCSLHTVICFLSMYRCYYAINYM